MRSQPPAQSRLGWLLVALLLAFAGLCWWWFRPVSAAPAAELAPRPEATPSVADAVAATETIAPTDGVIVAQPMRLTARKVVAKAWNSGPDALGLFIPKGEGPASGPSGLIYHRGQLHLLDSVNRRILVYDRNGEVVSTLALPTPTASDLMLDASDDSLLIVDHIADKIYKVRGVQVELLGEASVKTDFPYRTKFEYDAKTKEVVESSANHIADAAGGNLVIQRPGGQAPLTVKFDGPVAFVEEVATDGRGNLWVMYTQEGDYRTRRLARLDASGRVVGTAQVDVWFAFDATRRMTATENGVAILAGDSKGGRLLTFDFAGAGR